MCKRECTPSRKISHCKTGYFKDCRKHTKQCLHIQVTVPTLSRQLPWTRKLNDRESLIGRALAGGHIPSMAKAVVRNAALRDAVILDVLDQLDNECRKLCQVTMPSLFSKVPLSKLLNGNGVFVTFKRKRLSSFRSFLPLHLAMTTETSARDLFATVFITC